MNFKAVLRSLGILLICEAIAMIPSLIVSIIYAGDDTPAFIYTIFFTALVGVILSSSRPKTTSIYARDGFAIVAIGWMLISFFGALPFTISGAIPNFIDSFFESSSGFSTTGASILTQVENLPKGILFWRSFTHWIGGMGIIVLTLAILPSVGTGSLHIMKAESPGPTPGKLVPRVGQTAKILYGIYIGFTLAEIILLCISGMPLFDSMCTTFGTVGTGGFGIKNASIGAYNNIFSEMIIIVFMIICGGNFALYYQLLKGNFKDVFKDEELRLYLGIITASIILITINIYGTNFSSIWESLRHSSFSVASIITTTGFATADFDKWPMFSKMLLILLMFVGGCAGSTGGAIKNIRILLLVKTMKRELMQIIHPRAFYTVKIANRTVEEKTLMEVLGFFFMYILIFVFAVLIVSLDGEDVATTISAVAATLGNIGPGISVVGPMGNYSEFSYLSKITMSLCMIIGRLEIYPILLLMVPSFWKKVNI